MTKTGGRKKGTPNKDKADLAGLAEKLNVSPFEILLRICKGDWKGLGYDNEVYVMEGPQGATKIGYTISPEMRLTAAKEASKYLYAQKKALEVSGPDGDAIGVRIILEDYTGKK